MKTILVVDDDPDNAKSLAMLLNTLGHTAFYCLHGDEVMHRIEHLRPDILFLDIAMPTMTGFDVIKEFEQCPDLRPTKIVAITGYGDEATKTKALLSGFDHFLVKPAELSDLMAVLNMGKRIQHPR